MDSLLDKTWSHLPDPTLRRVKKPIVKNLLRGIRTYKRDAKFAGGLQRARKMLASRLLKRLTPTTNPVSGDGTEQPVPEADADVDLEPTDGQENGSNPSSERPRPSQAPPRPTSNGQQIPRRVRRQMKTHKDDLPQYDDDFYAHLTAEDIPDWNTDDLLVGNDADLPPEARKCPIDVRRIIRNAHNNLGHPSNHALVRLMKTAKCHQDMIAYARHMKCPTCARRQPPARVPKVTLPYRPTRFNAVVGLDLKWAKESKGDSYDLLHILDWATQQPSMCAV
jgi:hypothetical protein